MTYEIVCTDLAIGYKRTILHSGINFSIPSGSYVCILGENGAGKTTLVKTIMGLLKPVSGSVKVSDDIKKHGFGYLPQQGVVQKTFPTTVREVVLSGCQRHSGVFYSKADKQLAMDSLKRLGIEYLAKSSYSELSGGQQQRVLLARALCTGSATLVLDEPVTGLDIKNQNLLYDLVEKLNKEGVTILMISHDKDVLSKHATHILKIDASTVELKEAQ